MYISGFHIEGFGIYRGQGLHGLPPGLILFVGDNESGKTTLMAFIRTVLFGFRRKGSGNDYQPLLGGSHGGRLLLCMQDGRLVTVERLGRQATILTPEEAPRRGEPGELLLGGMDRDTFEHIFAIGLKELQGLEVLTREEVRGRLFSASAGLGPASVPAALKSIDEELAALWAPRAKRRLNTLSDRLRDLARDIKNVEGQAAAYAACRRQKEKLEARARREFEELENLRRRLRRLEQLEQAREPWAMLLTAQQKVQELEEVKDFPPHGLEQLEHLTEDLEQLDLSLREREAEAARLAERLEQIPVDEVLLAQREHIEAAYGEREKIAAALAELPLLRRRLNQAQEEFQGRLQDLGPDWDTARLSRVDTSVAVRQQVQEFGRRLILMERRLEQLQIQERFLEEETETAQRQLEEARRRLDQTPLPVPADPEELRQRKEILSLLRTLRHRLELWTAQLQERRLRQDDARLRLTFLRQQLETGYTPLPWWLGILVATAGFVASAFLSFYTSPLAGNMAVLLAIFLGAAAFLWHRHQLRQARARLAPVADEMQQVKDRIHTLQGEIAELESRLLSAEEEFSDRARQVADPPPEGLEDLERLAADLDQAAQELQNRLALEQEMNRAAAQLAESRERLQQAAEETRQARQELEAWQSKWRAWAVEHGFTPELQPEAFEAVLQTVERAREASAKVEEARLRLGEAESYLAEARSRLRALLEACSRPLPDEAGVEHLDALRRDLKEARENQKTRGDLENRLTAAREHLEHLRALQENKQKALARLLEQAGAPDPDEFRRRAGLHEEYQRWLKNREDSRIALLALAGSPEALARLEQELSQEDALELAREKEALLARAAALSDSVSALNQEVGRLQEQLEHLAREETLGDLLQEQSLLEEQFQEAMQRWAVLVLCRHLVEEARGVYERERQPQVIREADRFLGLMTGDRYRLVASLGDHSIQLEDRTLRRKDQIHWSDGLADQVYLAVRLGLAREFSRHTEPLPVILDDVLVKFDPRRRRGAARVILEFAREQQVLLFTCHPEFAEIVAALQQEDYLQETPVAYFRLSDGTIRPGDPPGIV
ncbi:MAG: AAA family ATPase [Deltaproteobacteria bacterium]|nr:AAA family ATPase [Deltaproteobacteria bacterium]